MITILLGILASTFTEVATALNKKLTGTVLQGNGAFLLATAIALIAAAVKTMTTPGFEWEQLKDVSALSATFSQVFTVSQIYFLLIAKKLNLDVQAPTGAGSKK